MYTVTQTAHMVQVTGVPRDRVWGTTPRFNLWNLFLEFYVHTNIDPAHKILNFLQENV